MSVIQYPRKFSLIVGSTGIPNLFPQAGVTVPPQIFPLQAAALEFSAFRVVFKVTRGDFQAPNTADIRIYNLADATVNKIENEFTDVAIQAGYEGNYGLIFNGTIKQIRKGKVDQKDSYVDITAADGDEAYNYSNISLSLPAGTQPATAVEAFIASMASRGITEGYSPAFSKNGCVRGRVYYGMTRDELRNFSLNNDCAWSIQNGQLTLIPLTSYIPGAVPVLSPTTGLIGVPEQIQNGISMRTLLNPAIRIGTRVKLDSSVTVNRYRYGLDQLSQGSNALLSTSIKTNADGLYYVMIANQSGDTRGEEWYTDLTCLSVDATVPVSLAQQQEVAGADSIRLY